MWDGNDEMDHLQTKCMYMYICACHVVNWGAFNHVSH